MENKKDKLEIEVVLECSVVIKDEEGSPIVYEVMFETDEDLETLAFKTVEEWANGGSFHSGTYTPNMELHEYVIKAIENGNITLHPKYPEERNNS